MTASPDQLTRYMGKKRRVANARMKFDGCAGSRRAVGIRLRQQIP
jgi:hypothetical protein